MTLYLSCFLHIGDNSKSALSQDEDDLLAEELLHVVTADANAFTVSTTNGALSLSSLSNASKNDFIMKRATKVAQGSLYGAIGRAMGYRVNGNIIMRPSTIRENIMSHRYH